jgi:hypothetical protein
MKGRTIVMTLVVLSLAASMLLAPSAIAQKAHPNWMYLLYLDADNSLDVNAGAHNLPVVQSDLDELMSVGSTSSVVCYVLVDRVAGPANLFKVNKGSLEEMTRFALDGKEIDMGDPSTLKSFVTYATSLTPADNTMLIFWDHGSLRYVAYDEHASDAGGTDSLTHQEVVQALSGLKVDVICADECNVGQIEIAYEYATHLRTQYLVAAETYTGWRGFPYDATLREMTKNPGMTPRDAAVMMVDQTQLLLNQPPYSGERVNTHAATDLAKVVDLVSSLKGLTSLITPKMADYANIVSNARGEAQYCYGANAENRIDLMTFVQAIKDRSTDSAVSDSCAAVISSLDATIVAIQASGSLDHMLFGLGITMPDHSWEMPSYYQEFAFPAQGWTAFLEAYWAAHGSV